MSNFVIVCKIWPSACPLCSTLLYTYRPWVYPDRDVKRRINLIYVLLPLLVGLISLWRSWRAHEDHKRPTGRGRSLRGSCRWAVCVRARACLHSCLWVFVCAWFGLIRTQTSSSLGRLTEPLTPLAHQAAEPSGWEIFSEWRQWESHLPSSTGPVWVWWDGAVCVHAYTRVCMCMFLSDAFARRDSK